MKAFYVATALAVAVALGTVARAGDKEAKKLEAKAQSYSLSFEGKSDEKALEKLQKLDTISKVVLAKGKLSFEVLAGKAVAFSDIESALGEKAKLAEATLPTSGLVRIDVSLSKCNCGEAGASAPCDACSSLHTKFATVKGDAVEVGFDAEKKQIQATFSLEKELTVKSLRETFNVEKLGMSVAVSFVGRAVAKV